MRKQLLINFAAAKLIFYPFHLIIIKTMEVNILGLIATALFIIIPTSFYLFFTLKQLLFKRLINLRLSRI
jgi:photosystem II reaction center protein PsbM